MKKVKERAIRVVSMAMALFLTVGNIGTGITIKAADTYSMSYHSEIYLDTGGLLDTLYHDDVFNDYYMEELDTNSYSSGDIITIQREPFYREAVEGSLELHNDIDVDIKYPHLQFLGYKLYKTVGATTRYMGIYQVGDTFINDSANYYAEGIYHDTNSGNSIAYAAENLVSGDYTYNLTMNNKAVIKQFTGSAAGTLSVPSSLDGYQVTEILSGAFTNLSSGVTLEIPDNMLVHEYAIKNYAPGVIKLGINVVFPDSNPVYGYTGFPRYLENAYATDGTGYYKQVFISPNTTWVKQHEISYARNDGTDYTYTDTSRYIAGEEVVLETPQKREDYKFLGWSLAQAYNEGDVLYSTKYTMPSKDVLMYGQWEVSEEYNVTYDTTAKGGLGTITDPTIYKAGDEVTILDCSNSAASGYEVEGIYENPDYSGTKYSAGDTFTIASDKPFYVRYVAIGYHLSFNKNGGNGDLADDTTVYNSGDIAVLPSLSSLTRVGYKAIGFSTTPLTLSKSASLIPIGSNFMCGMDMIYTANYNIYDNTLLHVVWQEVEIVVENYITYLSNGGEGLAPVDNTNYNDINNMNFTAMKNTFTRANYEFSSWNTKADGSGTSILEDEVRTAFTVFVLGTGKLYAQWTPKATPTPDPTPIEPEKKAHRVLYSMGIAGAYGISVSDSTVYYDGDTVTLITPTPSIIDIGDYTLIFTGYDHADNFIVTSTDSEYIWVTATWLLQPKETAKVWVTYLPGILPNVDNATDEKISTEVIEKTDKDESEKATEDTNTTEGNENTESGEGISKGNEMATVVTGPAITVDTTPDKNTESGAKSVIIISPESGSYNIGDSITVKESYATGYTNHAYMCPELGRIVAVGEKLVVPAVGLTLIALWTVDGGEVVIPTPTPDPEPTNPPTTPTPDPEPTNPPITPTPDPEPTNPPTTPTPEPTPEPPVVIIPTPDPVPPVVVTPVPITPEPEEPEIEDAVVEEPDEDDTIKEEDKIKEKEDDTDTGKSPEDKTGKEEETVKNPTEVEDKGETKKPTPTPSVIDPEIVAPEPSIEPEDDPFDVTSGIEGTEEPEPTPTPTPEIVDPTPTPNPTPDKPNPNHIIPIVIAVAVPPMFFFFFIWFTRRLYVLVKDSEGKVIKRKHRIRKPFFKSKPVIINMARFKKRMGTLDGVTIEISKKTLKKLRGYELRVAEDKKNRVVLYQYKVKTAKEICRITLLEEDN